MVKAVNKYYDRFIKVLWLLVWLNFFIQYCLETDFWEATLASSIIVIISYPFISNLYNKRLPEALRTKRLKSFGLWFWIYTFLATLLLVVSVQILQYLESRDFFESGSLFSDFGPVWYQFMNILLAIFFMNFGFCGLRFFAENLRIREELTDSQVKILSEQINPHFMFNVLNHIHTLMQKDVELASSLLLQYSDVLRYQLYNGKQDYVELGRELDFLENYIEVEKLRWKDRLDVNTQWNISDRDVKIRPLLFITFVENAFKHVHRTDREKGFVDIRFEQDESGILFTVTNSVAPVLPPAAKDSGIGLENARKRLEIFYPNNFSVDTANDGRTFKCTLKLTL